MKIKNSYSIKHLVIFSSILTICVFILTYYLVSYIFADINKHNFESLRQTKGLISIANRLESISKTENKITELIRYLGKTKHPASRSESLEHLKITMKALNDYSFKSSMILNTNYIDSDMKYNLSLVSHYIRKVYTSYKGIIANKKRFNKIYNEKKLVLKSLNSSVKLLQGLILDQFNNKNTNINSHYLNHLNLLISQAVIIFDYAEDFDDFSQWRCFSVVSKYSRASSIADHLESIIEINTYKGRPVLLARTTNNNLKILIKNIKRTIRDIRWYDKFYAYAVYPECKRIIEIEKGIYKNNIITHKILTKIYTRINKMTDSNRKKLKVFLVNSGT